MASFIGTNKEFRRYIGPHLRNLVQQITKNHKATVGACEHCGTKDNLESAHVEGRDRNQLIDLVLTESTNNNIITVELSTFEDKFKKEHDPIEKCILILCRSCHRKYDSKQTISTIVAPENLLNLKNTQVLTQNINKSGTLPIILEPSDANIFKQELLLSKQAEIKTYYTDGNIITKCWDASKFTISSNVIGNLRSRPEYRSGNWQSHGISKVHVCVIKKA